jgi:hypothetical protein
MKEAGTSGTIFSSGSKALPSYGAVHAPFPKRLFVPKALNAAIFASSLF